jgi:hypothetical protein
MTEIERIWVSHHQFEVRTGTDSGNLEFYTVGDDMVLPIDDVELRFRPEPALRVRSGPRFAGRPRRGSPARCRIPNRPRWS